MMFLYAQYATDFNVCYSSVICVLFERLIGEITRTYERKQKY